MRWKFNPPAKPTIGDKRIKRQFLLIPRVINNQWVWLERVLVEYTYKGLHGLRGLWWLQQTTMD